MWHRIDRCDVTRVVAGCVCLCFGGCDLVLSWCGMSLVDEVWCQLVWHGLRGYGMAMVGVAWSRWV